MHIYWSQPRWISALFLLWKWNIRIKCPYSCRDKGFQEASKDKSFCLEADNNGNLILMKDHMYYYQVQMQMELCHTKYCNFVVWNKDHLVCQWVKYDEQFIKTKLNDLEGFIIKCILPEPIAKWFTKHKLSTESNGSSNMSDVSHYDADDNLCDEHSTENVDSSDTTNQPSSSVSSAKQNDDTSSNDANSLADSNDGDSSEGHSTENVDSNILSSSVDAGFELWCYCRQDEGFDYLLLNVTTNNV